MNILRVTALDCCVTASADLWEVRAMLPEQKTVAQDAYAYAYALGKCLRQAVKVTITLYRPHQQQLAFLLIGIARQIDSF